MAFNDFSAETAQNYEQKCLCVLVIDTSFSMGGSKISQLNKGLKDFYNDISTDSTTANRLEISIITFDSTIDCIQDPALIENFNMPSLSVNGSTRLVDGVREGLSKLDSRKKWYKDTGQPYYRPWVILMTDGEPDEGQDVDGLSVDIQRRVDGKEMIFFAVGVQGANMSTLNKLSSNQMPPAPLDGLKFSEFFKWLSASMSTITSSNDGQQVDLADPDDWMQGFTI